MKIIRKAEDIAGERLELPDGLGGLRRGQEADFPGYEAGGESDREAIAVRADVDDVITRRKPSGDSRDVGNKLTRENGPAGAIRDDRIGLRVRYQRERAQTFTSFCAR
ncbi:MAG: hypothetical protein JWN85_3000 [Gammaproteobacteria bacterium]|nr:hypothetical protein [Gammaproteobacteria bacterium]